MSEQEGKRGGTTAQKEGRTESFGDLMVGQPLWLGYRGSVAHGIHLPDADPSGIDDKDLIGVFVGPPSHYLGIASVKETVEIKRGVWDVVHYEIRHFVRLLLKSNPNVLVTLWTEDKHVVYEDALWRLLKEERAAFASKEAYPAFTGYAYGQLKKMTRAPAKTEDREAAIRCMKEEIKHRENKGPADRPFLHHLYQTYSTQDLRTQVNALKGQTGYMGEKRKALVEKHGYDTKNAAHLIRLLRMGIEFLETGEMIVERPDAEELVAIKRGEWSLYAIEQLAATLFARAKDAVDGSSLPEHPDRDLANRLCMEITKTQLGKAA